MSDSVVLVTGASGFIGRHTVRVLSERGARVRCLVRARSDRSELEGELVEGDLGDVDSLKRALSGVEAVVHLASLLKVPWKEEFRTVNVGGTKRLVEAAARMQSPPAIVVVSSLAAAGPSEKPRVEEDGAQPISIYGRVKLASEEAALEHRARVPITIVRPPMVFGEGDLHGLKLFRSVKRGVHLVPSLKQHRLSMVHAIDLADALVTAAERGERASQLANGVYYVADDARPTYAELGRMVARACGFGEVRVVRVPSLVSAGVALISELGARIKDSPTILNLDKWREATAGSWICDASKARRELGFAPKPVEQRLAQTGEWYRQRGLL